MALCCIGGVCVPYTAVVPLIVLALKWVVEKLVSAGLLPAWLLAKLGGGSSSSSSSTCKTSSSSSCCAPSNTTSDPAAASTPPVKMHVITDEAEWSPLLASHRLVVVKLTASWCKPCKVIQPAFERLASNIIAANKKYKNAAEEVAFCTLDVDECDEVASALNVAMMPTFCIVQGGKDDGNTAKANKKPTVIDRYAGSNEAALQEFLSKHF